MQVTVKEVSNKKEFKAFYQFQNKLYKGCEQYVPSLDADQKSTLTSDPALDYCERKMWLAYKGDRVVGRIQGIINPRYNEFYNLKRIRFGWFDFEEDIKIAKALVKCKINNQLSLLKKSRKTDEKTTLAKEICLTALSEISTIVSDFKQLMGLEGYVSKAFFNAYFQDIGWKSRLPRTKCDAINSTLDIGYTILFNYIECFVRMFGFDLYVDVSHRLWFKRKSLICDLVEPFRCIIDHTIKIAFNRKQFSEDDFKVIKGEYRLKYEKNAYYSKLFFNALIPYKMEVFRFIQSYYRCFMQGKDIVNYPKFEI